jgi:hypothetical protein
MQAREVHKAVAFVVGCPSRCIASLCDEIGKSQFCRELATMLLVRLQKPLRLFWMDFNRGFNLPCADAKSSVWRCDGGCRFDNQGAHGEAVSLLMARRNLR